MSAPFSALPTTAKTVCEVAARLDGAGFSTSIATPSDPSFSSRGLPEWLTTAVQAAHPGTEGMLLVTEPGQDAVVLVYSRKEWLNNEARLSLFDDFPLAERFVRVLAVQPKFGRAVEAVLVDV